MVEKQRIQTIFTAKDYMELYRTQKPTVDLMLGIKEQWEFEDFLEEEDSLEEVPFWLYYSVIQGDFLEIGGYEEDVTEKVVAFLQKKRKRQILTWLDIKLPQPFESWSNSL